MKKSTLTISWLFPVFISASISGCVTTSNEQENLDATLWDQTSSEFPAVTIGTYSAATAALQRIVADGLTDVNRMAVVMDVDETVLDHIFLRGERPPNRCLSVLTDAEHEQGRWTSVDKTSRRQCVELDHDIVMLVGDLIEAANKLPDTQ